MSAAILAMPTAPLWRLRISAKALIGAAALAALLAVDMSARSQDQRLDCAGAELAVRQKLMPLLRRTDVGAERLVRNSIMGARIARAYCREQMPDYGVKLYRRVVDDIDGWLASVDGEARQTIPEGER
jgi:hypothetical protein